MRRQRRGTVVVLEDGPVVGGDGHRDGVRTRGAGGSGCALGALGTSLALWTLSSWVSLSSSRTGEGETAGEALGDGHIGAVYSNRNKHVTRLRHRAGRRDGDGLAVGAL